MAPAEPGPVGLLLPGMSLNATIFPAFPFPTLALDFARRPPVPVPGMDDYVRALATFVRTEQTWRDAARRIVIAHSFGGMMTLKWLAARAPGSEAVDGVVLVATTAGPMYDMVRLTLGWWSGRPWRVPLAPVLGVWNHPLVTRGTKLVLAGGRTRQVDFQRLSVKSDAACDIAGWHNTTWEAMRGFRLAMEGFDVRDALSRITVPAVVVHGSRDPLFPPEVGRALAAGLPHARFALVEGAGHVLPLTHGEVVVEAARSLL